MWLKRGYSTEANAPNGRIDVGLKVADEPMRAEVKASAAVTRLNAAL